MAIARFRDRISFVEGDGLHLMRSHARRQRAAFFIDPPYTAGGKKAGARLYVHHTVDHEKLFELTAHVAGDFLMTYDYANEVVALAAKYGFQTRTVIMKNTHHARMTELLVGRSLDWVC